MSRFIMNTNAQRNGDHEVHEVASSCSHMPLASNQEDLGIHASCRGAVALARVRHPNYRINGCYYCCNSCHTS
ncbi:hypothetical protein MD535_08190 [Vibrio sp. ZSDZ65]|uniref:Uncharacterized protein n=1 Tax=Vibrio qingdaonensis TaxID=2829491 RepID=A0A9X3CM96_9VIBR|nr:hypothetical protein [Vibrio qingdaonensis]MCW8345986.1 hypothetical protein [Vibrio qingdaonensis]